MECENISHNKHKYLPNFYCGFKRQRIIDSKKAVKDVYN